MAEADSTTLPRPIPTSLNVTALASGSVRFSTLVTGFEYPSGRFYTRPYTAGDVMPTGQPIQITLVRCKVTKRGLFVDSNFNIYSLNELLSWARRKTPFIVVDESTGEDITRLILDHGSDAGDP